MSRTRAALKLHHVGVAVADLDAAVREHVELLGFEVLAPPVDVDHERVRVCFLRLGDSLVELVAGVDAGSPVEDLLHRRGPGPYHLCYQVDDLDAAVEDLTGHGCRCFRRFEVAGHGRFAFLLAPSRQVFELCQPAGARG